MMKRLHLVIIPALSASILAPGLARERTMEAAPSSTVVWLHEVPGIPQRTGAFAGAQRHYVFAGARRDGVISNEVAGLMEQAILLQKPYSSFNAPPRLAFELQLEGVDEGLDIGLEILRTHFGTPNLSVVWDGALVLATATDMERGGIPFLEKHAARVPGASTGDGTHRLVIADTQLRTDHHPRFWGRTTIITSLGLTAVHGGTVAVVSVGMVAPQSANRNVPSQLEVAHGYWRADSHQNFSYFTDRPDNCFGLDWLDRAVCRLPDFDREAGSLLVYVKNVTDYPVHIHDVFVDGVRMEDARQSGAVVWHRVQPRELKAGEVGEIALRLDRRPEKASIPIRVTTTDETSISCTVPIRPESIRLGRVAGWTTTNRVGFTLERFAEDAGEMQAVYLDGKDVTAATKMFGEGYYHDRLFGVIETAGPLRPDGHHVLHVQTANAGTAASFKAMDPYYWRTGFGSLDYFIEHKDELHLNSRYPTGLTSAFREDMMAMAEEAGLRIAETHLRLHGEDTYDGDLRIHGAGEVGRRPGVGAIFLSDEPDARDIVSGHPAGYIAQELVAAHNRVGRLVPRIPTTLITDTTHVPWGMLVYGLIGDFFSPDCYTTVWLEKDPYYTFLHMTASAYASIPKPMVAFLEAHERSAEKRRITAHEIRLNAYYSLAAGAKGIGYWAYGNHEEYMHGAELAEMARINGQCEQVEEVLATGYPVDNLRFDSETMWGRSVMSPGSGMIVLAVNRDYTYSPEAFEHQPRKDAAIELNLPPWWDGAAVERVEENERVPISSDPAGGVLRIVLPELGIGEMFLVRPL